MCLRPFFRIGFVSASLLSGIYNYVEEFDNVLFPYNTPRLPCGFTHLVYEGKPNISVADLSSAIFFIIFSLSSSVRFPFFIALLSINAE